MSQTDLFAPAPPAMTLAEYAAVIGNVIRITPQLQGAWVTAELSDVRYSGGHCYMELIEKNQAGQTVAKLRANIWASRVAHLRRKFFTATQRDIATGMKVMVYGMAAHHPLYGLSFTINDIDPSYTLGDMERLRREILMRLQREGVIDRNRKLSMTPAPQRIAVVSAEGAAGYGDFLNQLAANSEGFVFYPRLFPAVMQGEKASASVRAALDLIESEIENWDCVAIVRGGGATTDLNGFDNYELALRVATFPLPVVVGIGHERDRTMLDEIAHTRMKTPTAVAAFFIDSLRTAWTTVWQSVDRIVRYAGERLTGEFRRLDASATMLPALVESRLKEAQLKLDRELGRIPALVNMRIGEARGRLDSVRKLTGMAAGVALQRARTKIEGMESLLEVLSPANTLRRGYSITRVNGKALTDATAVKPGDVIETELKAGTLRSGVLPPPASGN